MVAVVRSNTLSPARYRKANTRASEKVANRNYVGIQNVAS